MRPPSLPLLKLAFTAALVACGCSSDGKTPDCSPALRLYNVRSAQSRADARADMKRAAEQGCITLPAGFDATGDEGAAGSGGGSP